MLRLLTMGVAGVFFATGFAFIIIDGTRTIAGGELRLTAFSILFANQMPALENIVSRNLHPFLWNPVVKGLAASPAALIFAIVGLLLLNLCRRRGRPAR